MTLVYCFTCSGWRTLTRVTLPIEVVIGVAVATEIQSSLLISWSVSERNVVVGNILEEVNLFLLEKKTSSNRVDRSITPSLVEETAVLVKRLEEIEVRLAAEPGQATNLKVGPLENVSFRSSKYLKLTYEMALVVVFTAIVTEEAHRVALSNVLGVVLHELLGASPESGNGVDVLVERKNETVLLVVLVHDAERIVVNVAEELDGRLNTPVVFVVHHELLSEEETGLESAHVTVADRVTVDDLALMHILTDLAGLLLVNPLGEGPVLLGNQTIVSLTRAERSGNFLELLIERLVVKENPVIVVSAVETILNLANGLGNFPNILVTGESDKSSVHTGAGSGALKVVPARVVGRHRHLSLSEVTRGGSISGNLGSFRSGDIINRSSLASRLLSGSFILVQSSVALFSSRRLLAGEVDIVTRIVRLRNSACTLLGAGASRTAGEAGDVTRNGDGIDLGIGEKVEHSERLKESC